MFKKLIVLILTLAFVFSTATVTHSAELKNRLKGYILLQVEANGEAWYVNPNDGYRYYMKDGSAAYQMMREFGLGITNADLKKIPVGITYRTGLASCNGMPCPGLPADSDNDDLADPLEQAIGTDSFKADTDGDGFIDGLEIMNGFDPFSSSAIKLPVDTQLVDRLKGKILIQVEGKGEAWYLNPRDGKRHFLGSPEVAYQVMRYLSLGITTKDLVTIPLKTVRYSVAELGVSFEVPEDIADELVYKIVEHENFDQAWFSTKSILSLGESQSCSDALFAVTKHPSRSNPSDYYKPFNFKQFNNFDITIDTPQDICSPNPEIVKLQVDQGSYFKVNLKVFIDSIEKL